MLDCRINKLSAFQLCAMLQASFHCHWNLTVQR